jgi:hypothetical protein
MTQTGLPPLSLATWEPSRLYLHLLCQIVGKVKMALHPPMNHWWHVTLAVSARGLTTGAIPAGERVFDIELDLVEHAVVARASDGRSERVELGPRCIADVYRDVLAELRRLGVEPHIDTRPFKCKSDIPLDRDTVHDAYDRNAIHRAWTALLPIDAVFREFRGRFAGKCSPVHLYWHSLDLAVTRFSGRRAPELPGADPVTRESYTHELTSAGFWFGDDDIPAPAFYAYASPAPAGLELRPLRPPAARWEPRWGTQMALLRYDDLRRSPEPRAALLEFLQSSYEAAAEQGKWDRAALEVTARPRSPFPRP